jgi:3-oxoacyl-[acyl-carrier protein] reductase
MLDHDSNSKRGISRRHVLLAAATLAPAAAAVLPGAAMAQAGAQREREAAAARDKVALVTGSSRGIGAATAKRLARDGYAVTVNYAAHRDPALAVVREIEAAGGRAISVQADITDPGAVRRLFEENEKAFGGVDAVVSNAGVMRLARFQDMTDDDFNQMVDVNLKGGFYVLREAARRVRDGGRIIALSSSITQLRSPTYGAYAATKAAQELYVNILAKELEGRMISVNAIAPGLVNTTLFTDGKTPQQIKGFADRTPHKRLGEPSDIADVIAVLCSAGGSWINGQTVFANGGIV